jgi:hypothetical protein
MQTAHLYCWPHKQVFVRNRRFAIVRITDLKAIGCAPLWMPRAPFSAIS